MVRRWLKLSTVAGVGVGGYAAARYASGTLGYAPERSPAWVRRELESASAVRSLVTSPDYVEIAPRTPASALDSTALCEEARAFRARNDKLRTTSFVHCGPHSVGFPFLVHGGLLAALLMGSAQMALQSPDTVGTMSIRYKRPSFIDQILRIDTEKVPEGLKLTICELGNTKSLVEATYTV